MAIPDTHKQLLMKLGLEEKDFELFDGKSVSYEYDEEKGVRIYDPFYATSYNEYIDIDGWSSWNAEHDSFMGDILLGVRKEVDRRSKDRPKPTREEITEALQKKFVKKTDPDNK